MDRTRFLSELCFFYWLVWNIALSLKCVILAFGRMILAEELGLLFGRLEVFDTFLATRHGTYVDNTSFDHWCSDFQLGVDFCWWPKTLKIFTQPQLGRNRLAGGVCIRRPRQGGAWLGLAGIDWRVWSCQDLLPWTHRLHCWTTLDHSRWTHTHTHWPPFWPPALTTDPT